MSRHNYDVTSQPLKAWLRNRLKQGRRDAIDALGKRLIEDTRLPTHGSLGLYRAHMKAKHYSAEDIATFEHAWSEMRGQDAGE